MGYKRNMDNMKEAQNPRKLSKGQEKNRREKLMALCRPLRVQTIR